MIWLLCAVSVLALMCPNAMVFGMTQAEINFHLGEHNRLRSRIAKGLDGQPPAANMLFMEWSATAASKAQVHMDKCVFQHDTYDARAFDGMYVGQNLYAHSSLNLSLPNASVSWYNEFADYTYSNNSCRAGKMCGHYTQLVWANTYLVGCWQSSCPNYQWKTMVACDYAPAGNWVGELPYKTGKACSQCPTTHAFCSEGLCTTKTQCSLYGRNCTANVV